jgi:excisionase family DNA binding protein
MLDPAVSEFRARPRERAKLRAVRELLDESSAPTRVVVGDRTVEVPQSLVRVLAAAAGALESGDTIAVVNEEAELSPAQAAKLLGVSRQYVDRLIADGVLEARRVPHSSYRRIPVKAVLAHRDAKKAKRAGIREIVDTALDAGLEY